MPMNPDKPAQEKRADDERDPTDSLADAIVVDGREVGPRHTDRQPGDEEFDTPEKDAEVQSGEKRGS